MTTRPTVLVVEDDALIREVMQAVLQDEGFDAVSAEDVQQAVAALENTKQVDLVFADIDLGDRGGGYEVARCARRRRPDVKIVYTSGGAREDLQHERVEGASFVPKPYLPTAVCAMLKKALSR
jgi:CheY-like chemotaxis protein